MLSRIEGRVLGSLLEKERTTPDQYPLTLNALVGACNQSTNREPIMDVPTDAAEAALASLKAQGFARLVHPSHGRSVTRFRQTADEHFGWTAAQAAVMAVLLVRGPQTVSEVKARSERLHAFAATEEVETTLRSLSVGDEPHVVQLERQPGQKELRWQQLLAEEAPYDAARHVVLGSGAAANPTAALLERITGLEERVVALEAALGDLLA